MLALRQQSRGLARLAQLLQPQLPLVCTAVQQAAWAQQPAAAVHGSAAAAALGGGGGITGWLTSKVSGLMGAGDVEDLDLKTFGEQIKKARMLGGLTGGAQLPAIGAGAVHASRLTSIAALVPGFDVCQAIPTCLPAAVRQHAKLTSSTLTRPHCATSCRLCIWHWGSSRFGSTGHHAAVWSDH